MNRRKVIFRWSCDCSCLVGTRGASECEHKRQWCLSGGCGMLASCSSSSQLWDAHSSRCGPAACPALSLGLCHRVLSITCVLFPVLSELVSWRRRRSMARTRKRGIPSPPLTPTAIRSRTSRLPRKCRCQCARCTTTRARSRTSWASKQVLDQDFSGVNEISVMYDFTSDVCVCRRGVHEDRRGGRAGLV